MIGKPVLWICLFSGVAMAAGCSSVENAYKCRAANPDTRIAGCTAIIETGKVAAADLSVIYYSRGTAYSSKGDRDRAMQDYNEAIRLNSIDPSIYMARGLSYYSKGEYDQAIQDFGEPISVSPNSPPVYHYGHQVIPDKTSAYYHLGNAYSGRGNDYDNKADYAHAIHDFNEAIRDYDESIRLNPNYAFSFYGRALAYDHRGLEDDNRDDYTRAIQDFNEAIRLRPNDAGFYQYRGLAYAHEGDYGRSVQDLDQAIHLNPKDSVARLGHGVAYAHEGDYDRAIQDFDELIRLQPKDAIAHEARGQTFLFQSNLDAAIADLKEAIADAPSPRIAVSAALMMHVAIKRRGGDDSHQLEQVAAADDLSKWPGPLLNFDMGKMTASELLAAAGEPSDERHKWHLCQANYFTGEDAIFHHQQTTALIRLKAARDFCPQWDQASLAARAELKRLGVPDSPAK